jgi:hypothetical protein
MENDTFINVVNNAAPTKVPGLSDITTAIKEKLGGMSASLNSLTGSVGALVTKGLDASKLQSGLTALTNAGLDPAAQAKLKAAIGSMGTGIKLPTAATNTTNTSEQKAGLFALAGANAKFAFPSSDSFPKLGDAKIKMPTAEEAKKYDDNKAAIAAAEEAYFKQRITTGNAQQKYEEAKNTLPQGDPTVESLKSVWLAENEKLIAAEKTLKARQANA